MTKSHVDIVWFRQDLRLSDNPALRYAVDRGAQILPIYILDDERSGEWSMGEASRWWLHHSLCSLNNDLDGGLHLFKGPTHKLIVSLAKQVGARGIFWNRCYEPWRIARDKTIKKELDAAGVEAISFNGSLLFEPHTISKSDGTPYRVFTPFFRKGCLKAPPPRTPLEKPSGYQLLDTPNDTHIDQLGLLPGVCWYQEMDATWTPGEPGAQERLVTFLEHGITGYKTGRNRPDQSFVSRLSPHLHFGEVSPNQVWYAADELSADTGIASDIDHFLSELGWREFSYHLLFHFPELPRKNLQSKFDRFPWRTDETKLTSWQQGMTGFPIVDAGMRELWRTGYMHNRVRMIVGSFLVKNLLLHWHHGEDWFWNTLVDADLANNSASWQWIAGCGADAAPYFRIFNPVTQGRKFDPEGVYVRRYVPEISAMPNHFIHEPWGAPDEVLHTANIKLGETYPRPVVDLKASRERALSAFGSLRDHHQHVP